MDVLVYEYCCSGAPGSGAGGDSLRAEGRAMLEAFLADLAALDEVRPHTLLDPSLQLDPALLARGAVVHHPGEREQAALQGLAARMDAVLLIAPECDDLLLERTLWLEGVEGRLLGSSPAAVRLTGDKVALGEHLRARGVATLPVGTMGYPAVLKPRHGAGSQATFLAHGPEEERRCRAQAAREGWTGELMLQPFHPGRAVSVSFLVGPHGRVALPACEQVLSGDGRFHYLGGRLPLAPALDRRARALAGRAVAVVPGLCGYVGVDLILGGCERGSRDVVVEINPRPTTSYVGLRALARDSLARALLDVTLGGPAPVLTWKPDGVRFYPDGTLEAVAPRGGPLGPDLLQ